MLSGNKIEELSDQIFASGFDSDGIRRAAYYMQVDNCPARLGTTAYTEQDPHPECEDMKIPPRKLSVLCTREEFDLSKDLCGTVGLRYQTTKEGLLPLFGPQIGPGYPGTFYAVVYNATSDPITVSPGERIFKLLVHRVEGDVDGLPAPTNATMPNINAESPDLADLRERTKKNELGIGEIESGYRNVVLFGVFLIATSVFGVVLTAIGQAVGPNAQLVLDWRNPITITVLLFIVGWIVTSVAIIVQTLRD